MTWVWMAPWPDKPMTVDGVELERGERWLSPGPPSGPVGVYHVSSVGEQRQPWSEQTPLVDNMVLSARLTRALDLLEIAQSRHTESSTKVAWVQARHDLLRECGRR